VPRILRVGHVDLLQELRSRPLRPDVAYHTDDRQPRPPWQVHPQTLSDRVLAGPLSARPFLIHDNDSRGLLCVLTGAEPPASPRDAHHSKVVRPDHQIVRVRYFVWRRLGLIISHEDRTAPSLDRQATRHARPL